MRSSRDAISSSSPSTRRSSIHLLQAVALALLVFVALVMQIANSISFSPSDVFRSPEISPMDKFEHMFATKTKYWDQRDDNANYNDNAVMMTLVALPGLANTVDRVPLLQELELIQTQIVARHGIRYPTGGNVQEIHDLLKRLKPFEDLLPVWMRNYTLPYNLSMQGELAEAGQHELRKLGARRLARSGHDRPVTYSKEKYRIAHTHVARTRDSATAFASTFFENPKDVEYIEYPKNKDILLRFFDQCARYQREVKKNQTAQEQLHEFQRSSVMVKIAQGLKQSLGLKDENVDFSAKDLMAVQSACAFDIALYHHKHHWCSLMSLTFIHSLDYLDDLEQFYWIGGGYRINYEMAAMLLREIFSTMKEKASGKSALRGNFFFAHAETTLPLMTLLGYGDRSLLLANATEADIESRGFRTSILSPFAANIEFRLYKQKSSHGELYVQILVNEKEVPIPECGRVFCKLSEVENLWHYYLETYNFHEDCLSVVAPSLQYINFWLERMASASASNSFSDTELTPPQPEISAGKAGVQGDEKLQEDGVVQAIDYGSESKFCTTNPPLPIPLGSVVEVKIDFICTTSSIEAEYLREIVATDKGENQQLSVRGRLHLLGGISQHSVASASSVIEIKHCDNQTCFRLQTDKGNPIVQQFELSPDVVTNQLPQISIEIRSRRSQKSKLSLSIALEYLIKKLAIGVDYQTNLKLLDDQDRCCGRLNVSFRGGLLTDLNNNDQKWTTVEHEPEACNLTIKVSDLSAAENGTKDVRCIARIWSSTTGKLQTVSPLMWKIGGAADENVEANSVSLQVTDTATEIIFMGIYRYSTHERNELIGLSSFTIHSMKLSTEPVEQCVVLYSETPDKENECGSAILSLQTAPVLHEIDADKTISLAATGLGCVAYPVQSGELKCRLDVDILEVQTSPSFVAEGDSISVHLRVAQSNWKVELAPVKVVLSADGRKGLAIVNENAHTVICWAAKDRSFPVLEVSVYVQRQQKPNRIGIASRASLATSTHTKRRQVLKGAQRTSEAVVPALIATGNLHLSSFFSQQNVSVLVDFRLDVKQTFLSNDTASELQKVAVLSRLRASSSQENGAKSSTSLGFSLRHTHPVKGDVCIHLLQASSSSLRKANSLSSYYISISSGLDEVISSCCSADATCTLTWNQHLALHIACTGHPIVHLTLYYRVIDASSIQQESKPNRRLDDDQIIGYLTLPLFPSVLEEDHLLQLDLPFGMPLDPVSNDTSKRRSDPHFYKRGMLTLELQFLPTQQPKTGPTVSSDIYELMIHRLRGNFQDTSTSMRPSGLAKHVFIDICIMADQDSSAEEHAVGATEVISLSPSGITEVGEVVDLSNPIVAATLSNGSSNILVGRIRDLMGNYYGRVHLPLRKDWKERLVNRKKQVWYPVCIETTKGDVATTKNTVLMSLQARQQTDLMPQSNELGKFHVNICEVILTSGFDSSNLMKLGKYGGANVQLEFITIENSTSAIRSRTRQTTEQNDAQRWRWENEWFVFPHAGELSDSPELKVSLQIGVQANHPRLDGRMNLSTTIEDAKLRRLELWVPLSDQSRSDDTTVSAHLHIIVVYLPTIIGTLNMDIGESYTFSESEHLLQVDNSFYKCTINENSFSTITMSDEDSETNQNDGMCGSNYKRLRLPLDTRLYTSAELPELVIQRMGVTKTLGEFCLGVLSVDILSIADLCCLIPSSGETRERFTWCEFTDKSDRTKTTGVAKISVGFEPGRDLVQKLLLSTAKTLEKRVASAETFTVWKKLFYLLDQNGNGYIDRKEFTNIFFDHLEDMTETSDGKKLLQQLFGTDDNQNNDIAPTQQQIMTLFSVMDTNRDNEIEWSEYLRFLQHRQQQHFTTNDHEENPATDTPESTQSEQKRELRKKNREDRRTISSSSVNLSSAESNQDEMPPEKMREVKPVVKQEPAAPKRLGKVSSSEEKKLKLQYSNQEHSRLQQQISSLETILAIERRRYAELAADRQALMRSYQQLHLKHQNEIIQEQTKAKWMKQTIQRQQQQLEERETLRRNRNQASIVLQSTVRSRLEQKRYQGLKLQRANAAIAIQCMTRRVEAKKQFQVLQELDRVAKLRIGSASRMQRFIRLHLHRKERALLVEARKLSATILQKNARRMISCNVWQSEKVGILKLQCWVRQRLAIKQRTQLRSATLMVRTAVLGWFARWQYTKVKTSTRKLQKWWRRASKERSVYVERFEATLCIQSAWKRRMTRKWFEREWQRQEKYLSELEASICIQAEWRRRQQRLLSIRGCEATLWFNDDSAIEALLYDLVAMVEADVVIPVISFATTKEDDSKATNITTEDDFVSAMPENAIIVGDEASCGIDDVVGVLNGLVEEVVRTSDGVAARNERDVGPDQDEMALEDGTGDYSLPVCTAAPEEDIVTGLSRETPSELHAELFDDPDCLYLSIIKTSLEEIKDLVVSSAVVEENIRPVPVQVQDLQQSSPDNKHNEVHNEAGEENNTTEDANDPGSEMISSTSDGEHKAHSSIVGVLQEKVTEFVSLPTVSNAREVVNSDDKVLVHGNDNDTTCDERAVVDQPDQEEGDSNSEVATKRSEELEQAATNIVADQDPVKHVSTDVDPPPSGIETQDGSDVESILNLHHDGEVVPDEEIVFSDTTVGDFAMLNDSDSDESNNRNNDSDSENGDGSSIDSTDLMMEADAMAIISEISQSSVPEPAPRTRKATRMDSSILLADVDQLNALENSDKPQVTETNNADTNEGYG